MRHQRLTVAAVVTLIVALVTTGAAFVTGHPHDGNRRRNPPARALRGGVQRLDAVDAISQETDHHDPVASPVAEGLTARAAVVEAGPDLSGGDPSPDIHAFPPGLVNRVFSSAGDAHVGAAYPTVHFVPLRLPSSRQVLGRAPPAL